MDPKEIREKISSNNLNILKQSILFLDDRLALLRERSKLAETRATAMLVVLGIYASFMTYFGKTLQGLNTSGSFLILIIYFSSIFLLIKAIYYAVKVLWVLKGYELNSDLAYDLQKKSETEALKEELIWKIWEYREILPHINEKLFFLNRSQRNSVATLITFMFLGIVLFIQIELGVKLSQFVAVIITIILTFLVFFNDIVAERCGGVWHKR